MSCSRGRCCSSGAAGDRPGRRPRCADPPETGDRLAAKTTEVDHEPGEWPVPTKGMPHVVLLSGLSGGGKTAAAKLFEDLAYTVVDNLPGELLPNLAELVVQDPARFARVAIVLDVRAGDAESAYRAMRGALEGRGIRPQVF